MLYDNLSPSLYPVHVICCTTYVHVWNYMKLHIYTRVTGKRCSPRVPVISSLPHHHCQTLHGKCFPPSLGRPCSYQCGRVVRRRFSCGHRHPPMFDETALGFYQSSSPTISTQPSVPDNQLSNRKKKRKQR